MYLMFVMMAAGGLDGDGAAWSDRQGLQIADVPVSLLGLTLPALTFALSIDRVSQRLDPALLRLGLRSHRPREHDVHRVLDRRLSAFRALSKYGQSPVAFVVLTGIVFFAWGEIYSLFPATCGDTFGSRYARPMPDCCTPPRARRRLLVPLTSVITAATGSWHAVFMLASGMAAASALLALFVLKPMRQAHKEKHASVVADMPFGSALKE
jgi:OFA family oxalate/formate antiporter-like MFS transporter